MTHFINLRRVCPGLSILIKQFKKWAAEGQGARVIIAMITLKKCYSFAGACLLHTCFFYCYTQVLRKCEPAFKCWINQDTHQCVTEGKDRDGHHTHSWSLGTALKVFWCYMNTKIKQIAQGPTDFSLSRIHSWWFCLWSYVKLVRIFFTNSFANFKNNHSLHEI